MRIALMLVALMAGSARAACTDGGGPLNLLVPNFGDAGNVWSACLKYDIAKISTAAVVNSTTAVQTSAWLQTARIGGISTGPVGIWISSAVTVTSSMTVKDSFGSTGTITAGMGTVFQSTLGAGGLYVPYGVEAGTVQTRGQVAVSTTIGGNGNHRVRAGTGDGGGTTPIVLYSHAGSSTTGNTSATSWITADQFTVRPNSLVNDGDTLEVFCVAKATSTNLTKGVETTINGTQTANGATGDTGTRWTGLTTIRRTSATTADFYSERHRATGFASDALYAMSVTFGNAFNVTCDIRASATAYPSAAGDENMDLKYMRVILYPAP